MKAHFSPLKLLDFKLLQNYYKFEVAKEEIDIKDLFDSYQVDIDFGIGRNEEDQIQLVTMIEVNLNDEQKKPGYRIMVEGGGTFVIKDAENLEENLKNNLSQFSTLNMMINNLRNIIYQITNLGPMGGYLLPPIDITRLINDKAEQQEKNKTEQQERSVKKQKKRRE